VPGPRPPAAAAAAFPALTRSAPALQLATRASLLMLFGGVHTPVPLLTTLCTVGPLWIQLVQASAMRGLAGDSPGVRLRIQDGIWKMIFDGLSQNHHAGRAISGHFATSAPHHAAVMQYPG